MSCGTIAALAVAAAGTGAAEYANVQEGNNMNSAVQNALANQNAMQAKASNVFNQSLGASAPPAANRQIGQGATQALQQYQGLQALPLSASTGTNSLPTGQQGIVNAQTSQGQRVSNQNNAGLQGYGNYSTQQGINNLLSGANLGLINNQAQSQLSTLPYQLQGAQNSQAGLAALGGLGTSLGNLWGVYNTVNPGAYSGGLGAGWAANAPGTYNNWSTPSGY